MVSFAGPPGSPCAAMECRQYERAAGSMLRQSPSNAGSSWRGSAGSWASAATEKQHTLAASTRIHSPPPYDDLLSRTATPHRGNCDRSLLVCPPGVPWWKIGRASCRESVEVRGGVV